MAKRQYVVTFTVDSSKFGDALADLKILGVNNLAFDLLQAHVQPEHFSVPGNKPTRSAVVMKPRQLPAPSKGPQKAEGLYNGSRRARILNNGKNASQTVVDYVRSCGEVGADPTDIATHLKGQGYDKGKGPHAIAPTLVYSGILTRNSSGPNGRTRYFINPDYTPKKHGGKKPAAIRPDLYMVHGGDDATGN